MLGMGKKKTEAPEAPALDPIEVANHGIELASLSDEELEAKVTGFNSAITTHAAAIEKHQGILSAHDAQRHGHLLRHGQGETGAAEALDDHDKSRIPLLRNIEAAQAAHAHASGEYQRHLALHQHRGKIKAEVSKRQRMADLDRELNKAADELIHLYELGCAKFGKLAGIAARALTEDAAHGGNDGMRIIGSMNERLHQQTLVAHLLGRMGWTQARISHAGFGRSFEIVALCPPADFKE